MNRDFDIKSNVRNKYLGFNLSIEGLSYSISSDELLESMLRIGTFGVGSQVAADASRFTEVAIEEKRSSKVVDTFHLIFPSWGKWKGFKSYLVDKPWMFSVEWYKREGRFMKKNDKVNYSEISKVADRRIELMKKCGVI